MPTEPLEDEQIPGLAGARSDLAWNRAGLALVVAGAATLRITVYDEEADAPLIVFALLALGVLAWLFALVHARTIAKHSLAGRRVADPTLLRSLAWGTTAFALGALVLAVTHT